MSKKEIIVYSDDEEEVMCESKLIDVSSRKKGMNGIDLLREMYEIFSPSGAEHAMATYVSNWLAENEIPHTFDSAGNIYAKNAIEGSRRILVNAHMDTVADAPAEIILKKTKDDVIVCSSNNQVIGADDKNGVWSVLRLLADESVRVPLSALLCVSEETGCNGSEFAMKHHSDQFDDCVFCITIDRRGDTDIIVENFDIKLCSDKMKTQLNEWGEPFGLSTTTGSISDVSNIVDKLHINGINLFAGYHNAHSGSEYTSMKELAKSFKFQLDLLPLLHNYFVANPDDIQFTDTTKSYSYSAYGKGAYSGYSDWGYYGVQSKQSGLTVYEQADDLELPELKDEFMDIVDDLDILDGRYKLYDEIADTEMSLSKSKKSLILEQGWYLIPDAILRLQYYFNVSQGNAGDACISVKEIREYEHQATNLQSDWDSHGEEF
jgi:hypothetical protein